MKKIDTKVLDFLDEHHLMTLATVRDNVPHTSNMFYAFDAETGSFIFTSKYDTKHVGDVKLYNVVACNVALETKNVSKVQGLQITGRMMQVDGERLKKNKKLYLKKFPFAVFVDLDLWVVEMDGYKFTDNTLGFGKKLLWTRE